jgi:hypothetical protein
MLAHHGRDIGLRHARKHLGWALDTAAATAGAPAYLLKAYRNRVLTATDPAIVLRRLAEAFDAFGGTQKITGPSHEKKATSYALKLSDQRRNALATNSMNALLT